MKHISRQRSSPGERCEAKITPLSAARLYYDEKMGAAAAARCLISYLMDADLLAAVPSLR